MSDKGMVVARAMRSETAAEELRETCMAVALELGGWKKKRARKLDGLSSSRRPRSGAENRTP